MIRLIGAELLKLRRRWASYVVLGVLVVLMALVYLLIGALSSRSDGPGDAGVDLILRFPNAYAVVNQFVFGLGSLRAVAYAAAIGGADWTWGVLRVVVARGEGRSRYVIAKAAGIAVMLILGVLIAYGAGILFTFGAASLAGISPGSPLGSTGGDTLWKSLVLGTFVLLQRAAIGYAVAVLTRSQVAGVVVGIILFLGESILATILTVMSIGRAFGGDGLTQRDTQWYQYLPFSIGDSVLSAAASSLPGDLSEALLRPVALEQALIVTGVYLVVALAIAALATERAEIA
jgi:ABC-type transport system involved in multi-copper enzyme maturation permease subunit